MTSEEAETAEISEHQLKVFDFVKKSGRWLTTAQIAEGSGVCKRTVRHHTLRFVAIGIFEKADVSPGHRYRVTAESEATNPALVGRLEAARAIFNNS